MQNIVDLKNNHQDFKTPDIWFSVSSRGISPDMNIIDYLKIFYMYTDIRLIDSVFGNTITPSGLYGGRSFKLHRSLTDRHIRDLEDNGIGLSLTLTNHFFDDAAYRDSLDLLNEHHKKGNSVICTNDDLAIRIKNDFPKYLIKASIIKKIDNMKKINANLKLYDYLVLPMDKNNDDKLLHSIKEKKRIILFGNANCAYTCPERTCYKGFSEKHLGKSVTSVCSKSKVPRLDVGYVYFNIKKFKKMGFSYFKLVPLAPNSAGAIASLLSKE